MFKKMSIVALLLSSISSSVWAGDESGKIEYIRVRASDNLHYFSLIGTHANRPDCASGQEYWMIKDENSAAGKTQISILLTAYATGKEIAVIGTGKCDRWGDGEDVNVIVVTP